MSCFALFVFTGTALIHAPAASIAWIWEVPPQVGALQGTLWRGRARLDGGTALSWEGRWRSLLWRGRIEATLRLRGPQTTLDGTAFAGPWQVGVSDVTGRAGADLLALMPNMAPCEVHAMVEIDRLYRSRGQVVSDGRVRVGEAVCRPPGREPVVTPPLNVDLTTESREGVATITTDDAARSLMGSARLGPDGWVRLRVEPAAARLIPGVPSSAPITLEFQFD